MSAWFVQLAARVGMAHARRTYAGFLAAANNVAVAQEKALRETLRLLSGSDFGRRHRLERVRSAADLKSAVPLGTYEDFRPYVDRLRDGDHAALFCPGCKIHMFATSSGTTAQRKYIPVTEPFVRQYRRGWNTFGYKLFEDHPQALLRSILQSSGRHDEHYTRSGLPCGAITGLLARTQKRIVRRFYVGRPEIAHIGEARARYYTLMRFGVVRDVALATTANPATLIQLARTADEESETLIRDVHDGTLSPAIVSDRPLRDRLQVSLRPDPSRAARLAELRSGCGTLRPRDYWRLCFLACWTGGSMGHYLPPLASWYGELPVRDVGLLASEGRVSIPIEDGTSAGVLDVQGAFFEFVPIEHWHQKEPETLLARELELGRDYAVVLSNASGLIRYRLDDVVRVRGWLGQAPLLEFLHRAGRVSSVAGEKLTEDQVVAAVREAAQRLRVDLVDFVLAPVWGEPPFYRLNCPCPADPGLADAVDRSLQEQNEEYASRRKSARLGAVIVRAVEPTAFATMDRRNLVTRASALEQYKRPCLLLTPGEDDVALSE